MKNLIVEEALLELDRMYSRKLDEHEQFNRWRMADAMIHGFNMAKGAIAGAGFQADIEAAAKVADDLAGIAGRSKLHPQPLAIDTNEAWRRVEDAARDIASAIRSLAKGNTPNENI